MTRYIETFSWTGSIQQFLNNVVLERPLLNVCSGATKWGDINLDMFEPSDVKGEWINLPFSNNSFSAVFADPPWDGSYKANVSKFVHEALRIAPVAYLMAPWIFGGKFAKLTNCWVRQFPGINNIVAVTRYERNGGST
jgi:hypothetical protein